MLSIFTQCQLTCLPDFYNREESVMIKDVSLKCLLAVFIFLQSYCQVELLAAELTSLRWHFTEITIARRKGGTSLGRIGIVFAAASDTCSISWKPWCAKKLYGCFVSLKP